MGDPCWRLEDNPLVHSDSLLITILLDGDVASEEQQAVRGDFRAVIQVYAARSHLQVVDEPIVVKIGPLHVHGLRVNRN